MQEGRDRVMTPILPTPPCCPESTITASSSRRPAALLALALIAGSCQAEEGDPAPSPTPDPAPAAAPASPPATTWEGAIGLTVSHRPEYSGASTTITKATPALFLRYGRFTITNASGFVTRRADDVVRGLGADLVNSERVRVNLALRFDGGRSESTSTALEGLGNIKPTVRARMNVGWRFEGPWRLGASWSVDALGKGGGNFGDVSAGWEHRISPHTVLAAGIVLSAAGDRYMQTYYGISEAQAARTAYPVYTPKAGLRDIGSNVTMRMDVTPDWILLAGGGMSRLLGPAADSLLTTSRSGWGINVGLARRF